MHPHGDTGINIAETCWHRAVMSGAVPGGTCGVWMVLPATCFPGLHTDAAAYFEALLRKSGQGRGGCREMLYTVIVCTFQAPCGKKYMDPHRHWDAQILYVQSRYILHFIRSHRGPGHEPSPCQAYSNKPAALVTTMLPLIVPGAAAN